MFLIDRCALSAQYVLDMAGDVENRVGNKRFFSCIDISL